MYAGGRPGGRANRHVVLPKHPPQHTHTPVNNSRLKTTVLVSTERPTLNFSLRSLGTVSAGGGRRGGARGVGGPTCWTLYKELYWGVDEVCSGKPWSSALVTLSWKWAGAGGALMSPGRCLGSNESSSSPAPSAGRKPKAPRRPSALVFDTEPSRAIIGKRICTPERFFFLLEVFLHKRRTFNELVFVLLAVRLRKSLV